MESIYIAKHYWKNGENSKWECHSKIDKKLFQHIKDNYHKFEKEQPTMIKHHHFFIYLCYEKSKDIYEREIVNITFYISKSEITQEICSTSYTNLEIRGEKKVIPMNFIVMGAIPIILSLIFLFSSERTSPKEELGINTTKSEKKDILAVENFLQQLPHQVKTINEFNRLNKGLKDPIILNSKINISNSNIPKEIESRRELFRKYRTLLTEGANINIRIEKNQQNIPYKKLYLDQDVYNENKPFKVLAKEYRLHLVFEGKKKDFIDDQITLNQDEIIQLYQVNDYRLKKEIKENYSILIEKGDEENDGK